MSKQSLQIKNFITPADILAIFVIIIGLIVALYFEEIAVRMIGVCISILSAVVLFMLISQRISDVVESRFNKSGVPQPEFKMTITKDSAGKIQTVEDFSQSFGTEDDFPINTTNLYKSEISESAEIDNSLKSNIISRKSANSNETVNDYHDGFSGMRIVGKVKPVYKDQTANATSTGVTSTAIPKPTENVANEITDFVAKSEIDVKSYIKKVETVQEKLIEDVQIDDSQDLDTDKAIIRQVQEEAISNPEINKYKGKIIDLPINVFMETDQILGDEPKKEFEYFLTRILTIIRSSTDTRTALFLLFNAQEEELILESYVTSVPIALKPKLRFKLAGDIVSQIITNAKPQILTEINPVAELDLIPYYNTNTSTGSLIGVPVFWGEGIVGVLIADSESRNAYDSSTVAFLGHFTKLVGALVKSYTHKYDLLQASKTLEAINNFYTISSNSKFGNENISESIAESLKIIFPNSVVGLCGFDAASDNWMIKSYRGSGTDCTGKIVLIDNSLVGLSIYECKSIYKKIDKKSEEIRVYENEQALNGEFIAVPIKSETQIYGAIYIEYEGKDSFTEFDISVLELIGEHAGNSIERLYLLESLNSGAIYDKTTELYNPVALYRRLQEELARAKDNKGTLALCFFKFDEYASLDPINYPNRFEYTSQVILERIKRYIKIYDVYGRVDEQTFGIVFVGKDSNQSRMIAERIRADVANTIIEHGGGRFSVTISMGMVSPTNDYDIDTLVRDAMAGLERAFESGNQVQVLY